MRGERGEVEAWRMLRPMLCMIDTDTTVLQNIYKKSHGDHSSGSLDLCSYL